MKKLIGIATILAVSGCVSPEVVQTRTVADADMSCSQIRTELAQLEQIRSEAREGKTASGKNIAAGILFWPALLGNYANAQEATEAANKRQEVLVGLSQQKRC